MPAKKKKKGSNKIKYDEAVKSVEFKAFMGMILLIAGVLVYSGYVWTLENYVDEQDTLLFMQDTLHTGSTGSLRIVSLNHKNLEPIAGADVRITVINKATGLETLLYTGKTDDTGSLEVSFPIPSDMEGEYQIRVEVWSRVGVDVMTKDVSFLREYKLLLSTDKPLYQPGQTVHIRSLALSLADKLPAKDKEVIVEVEDPKANKLYKKRVNASAFGVVGLDYTLADEVSFGTYTIRASIGDVSAEKKVEVKKYVLPKFGVTASTEKTYYLPGENLKGTIKSEYFFGKPVSGGSVNVVLYTYEINMRKIAEISGRSDESGVFTFEKRLPDSFIGLPLEKGSSLLFYNVSVTDGASHTEEYLGSVPIARGEIYVDVYPESGDPVKGVENIFYIVTSYPDGTPAETNVKVVNGNTVEEVRTSPLGIAEYRTTPKESTFSLEISATDASGKRGDVDILLPKGYIRNPETYEEFARNQRILQTDAFANILLRTDRGIYDVGDTLTLDIYCTRDGNAYIDVSKDKQTYLTKSVRIDQGHATLSIALDETMAGTLEIRGYVIDGSTDTVRDTKTVYVNHGDGINLGISADRLSYKPGETAVLSIDSTLDGRPVASAVGVNVVDQAVYALRAREIGFERLYFELEDDIMTPNYMIYGVSLPYMIDGGCDETGEDVLKTLDAEEEVRLEKILFSTAGAEGGYDIEESSREEKMERISQRKEEYFRFLCSACLALLYVIPLLMMVLPALKYRGCMKRYTKHLLLSVGAFVISAIFFFALFVTVYYLLPLVLNLDTWDDAFPLYLLLNVAIAILISGLLIIAFAYHLRKKNYVIFMVLAALIPIYAFYTFTLLATTSMNYHLSDMGPMNALLAIAALLLLVVLVLYSLVAGMISFVYAVTERRVLLINLLLSLIYPLAFILGIVGMSVSGDVNKGLMNFVGVFALLIPLSYYIFTFELVEKKRKTAIFTLPSSMLPVLFIFLILPVIIWQLGVFNVGQGAVRGGGMGGMDMVMEEAPMAGSSPFSGLLDARKTETAVMERNIDDIKAKDSAADEGPGLVRIRRYFPETLYSDPGVLTDESGHAQITIPLADSITTWKVAALASDLNGNIGSGDMNLTVFQDLFIDLDLPVSLTQGDQVTLPVMVYNYLGETQAVSVALQDDPWFELMDVPEKEITLSGNEVGVVYYTIRAKEIGTQTLTATASGSSMSDGVSRTVEITPDGKEFRWSESGPLERDVSTKVGIPESAIKNSEKILVKIYPGIFSQVVEGLDSMFRMPYGCFEQTSSITYPNVLTLDYLQSTGQLTPETQFTAEGYISAGYQKLLTFETAEAGGFSIFGNPPAERMVTAYGLMQFDDMAKVYTIDDKIVPRMQKWLISQQDGDHWAPDGDYGAAYKARNSDLAATCYITWSLLETGVKTSDPAVRKSISYILRNYKEEYDNPYALGVCALALEKGESDPRPLLERLDELAVKTNDTVYWVTGTDSHGTYRDYDYEETGRATQADIETTALVTIAFMESGYGPEYVNKALKFLVKSKDSHGGWGSTQATVLSLKALLSSRVKNSEKHSSDVKVLQDGRLVKSLHISGDDSEVMHVIDLSSDAHAGTNDISIEVGGDGSLYYQVAGSYYLKWDDPTIPSGNEDIRIDVSYDKTSLHVSDIAIAKVNVGYYGPGVVNYAIIDLGIPPGFDVYSKDLEPLVSRGSIEKYEIAGRRLVIYIRDLDESGLSFAYRLQARYPVKAQTPRSLVYDYYDTDVSADARPVGIDVTARDGNSSGPAGAFNETAGTGNSTAVKERIDDWCLDLDMPVPEAVTGSLNSGLGGVQKMTRDFAASEGVSDTIGLSVGGAKDGNNFRRNIDEGYLPLPTDITYEGLFYDYFFDTGMQGTCEKLFCPSYNYAISKDPIAGIEDHYLMVGLNSGMKEEDFERKKLNLVVVLDISGSMSAPFNKYYYDRYGNRIEIGEEGGSPEEYGKTKIQIASESVVSLMDHLKDDDRFGIVVYNNGAYLAKPMRSVGETDMSRIAGHVLELGATGGTYMSAGMRKGTELFEGLETDGAEYENRIIFLTDAMPNIGETSEEGLAGITRRNAAKGIYTTFIGVGVDFNTELVEALTKTRGANYYSVHSPVQFRERMDEEFEYMVTPLVFDLTLTLESEGFEILEVYGSPEADLGTGTLMKVNTLFPSKKVDEETKGGIILLKLRKTGASGRLSISTGFENRQGEWDSDKKTVEMDEIAAKQYENTGVRKGILLARYADLVTDWIIDEARYGPIEPEMPLACGRDGIIVPPRHLRLGEWERQSKPLHVSAHYRQIFRDFTVHFRREMEKIDDASLEQEIRILEKLGA